MARKKKVEEPVTNTEEKDETSYTDVHNKDMSEIAVEAPVKETQKDESTEEVKPEVKEEVKTESTPVVDPEKMKAEIKETVSKELADSITKAITGDKKATAGERDRYEVIAEDFAKKNGRNPTWFELVRFIKDDIRQEMKAESEAEVKKQEEYKKQVEEYNKKESDFWNKKIDNELDDLIKSGKLPNTPEARKALFQAMYDENQRRAQTPGVTWTDRYGRTWNGLRPIESIKEIFYEHYKAPTTQPAGADAPVSAGRGNAQPDSTEDYSYHDIHKTKGFGGFFRR